MPLESLQNGRYLSERLLGSGSMGEVYLFNDTVIGRRVAIKLMRADPAGYPDTQMVKEAVKLFKREAQAIARLEHPNILPLYDFGEERRENTVFTYMVMPHCQEGSLNDWLQQHYPKGPVPLEEVAYFVEQAAVALQYAHEHGIIHQDVKPSNFLLRTHAQSQNLPDLLLADFGVAKMSTGATANTTYLGPRGTPRYMPPEQWESKPVSASDQYALVVMAYQLLTRTLPFQGEQLHQIMYQHIFAIPEPPSKHNPHIPSALDAVIMRALAKKPTERFPTVQAFATAFRQALKQRIIDVPTMPVLDTPASAILSPEEQIQPFRPQTPESLTTATFNTSGPTIASVNEVAQTPKLQTFGTPSPAPLNTARPIDRSPSHTGEPGAARLVLPGYSQPPTPDARTAAGPGAPSSLPLPPAAPPMLAHSQQPVQHRQPMLMENTQQPFANSVKSHKHRPGGSIILFVSLTIIVLLGGAGLSYYFLALRSDPNQNPYTSTMSNLRYYDPLSQPARWQPNPNNRITNGYCLFQQGAYHVSSNVPTTYTLCLVQNQPVSSDMTFEVQMQNLHGNCGGILFRGDFELGNFYYFALCSDGRHYLATYAKFQKVGLIRTNLTPFPALQANSQATVDVAIIAQGSSLTFYLDKQQIDRINDTTYRSGQVTLFCYEIDQPTEVVFSNARLWTP